MPDNRKSVVVDIISDSRKFLSGFEEAIKEIEKTAKKADILGGMQDDIDELKQSILGVKDALKNIKPTTDDSAIQKLQNKMESLDNSIEYLKKNIKDIKFDVNESSGKNVEKQIGSIKTEVTELITQMREASGFIEEIFNIKNNNASNAIGQSSAEIESYKKKLQDLLKIQKQLEAKDTTIYSKMKFKEAEEELDRYKDKYTDLTLEINRLNERIQSGNLQDKDKGLALRDLSNYKIELASVSREIIDIQDRLVESKTFKGEFFDVDVLNKNIKTVEKILDSRISGISSKIASLSKTATSSVSTNTFELKDGKIRIPVELEQTVGKLKSTLKQLLGDLQTTVEPVTVPIQLVSAYKTNTKQEVAELKEIKALQSGIDQITDKTQKSIAQSTLDKIKAQFQKELQIDIKTNISEAEKDINRGINAIKKILKDEKIIIYPEVELTEENKAKFKNDILKISKDFKIDFPVSDFEQSIKTLTDETLIKNWGSIFTAVIDEVCSRIEKATGQLQMGSIEALKATSTKKEETTFNIDVKELKEILEVLQRISGILSSLNANNITFNLDSEELKKTNTVLSETYNLISQIFDASGLNGISKQFDILREKFHSIAKDDGSFDSRKKEIKELIAEYQRYYDMGGKQPITDLTQNIKSQEKLVRLYEKQSQQQKEIKNSFSEQSQSSINTTELIGSLDNIIKKIQEKNDAFKNEEQIVSSVVSGEIESLERLVTTLNEVKRVLEEINVSSKGLDFSNISNLSQLNKLKPDKIANISVSLSDLANGINGLKLKDGNIFETIQDILKRSDELKNLATALKSTVSQINAVKSVSKEQSAQNLLTGSEQDIKYFGKESLEKDGLTVLSTSLKATSKGTVELIALVRDLNNEFKEYTLSTSNGVDFTTVKIDEGTKSIEKQAVAWKKLKETSFTPSISENYLNNTEGKIKNINPDKYMPEFAQKLRSAQEIIKKLRNDLPLDFTNQEDIERLQKLMSEIDEGKGLDINKLGNENNINNLIKKTASLLNENTGATKEVRSELRLLLEDMERAGKVIPNSQVQEFTKRLTGLQAEMQKTGKVGRSFFDMITTKATHMSASLVAQYLSFYDLLRYAREGFETIKEYDKVLTEMNKVSDESIHTLKEYQQESFKTADAIGAVASQLQNSTADWQRLGESLDEAKQSAQDTNILFNVSEFETIDEATESLVSMSQAFKELEKGEIVDVVNNLGNNFAISTDGLATALKDSASSLQTAQNDFYESAALVTAANTVVQDPAKVGAGLRTIALRLTGTEAAREELAALGEDVDDFIVTTTSKMDQQIQDLTKTQGNFGVSLLDMNGNYRSTYDVLLDIAKVWDQIAQEDLVTGENRQNALLEMMAGKNRSNILASVLQSPDILEEAYAYALDSEGSALKENEAYLESIQGHLDRLKNSYDNLWINENNREVITGFLDIAKVVLDLINDFGVLKTLLIGGGGIFAAIKSFEGDGRLKKSSLIFM